MEKLLAVKDLKMLRTNQGEKVIDYIYTDQLLERQILIQCDSNQEENLIYTEIIVHCYNDLIYSSNIMYLSVDDHISDIVICDIIFRLVEVLNFYLGDDLIAALRGSSDGGFSSDQVSDQIERREYYESRVHNFKAIVAAIRSK
jgi:hypothetical protein